MEFDTSFSYWKLADMGFQLAHMERCYLPVPLKVTFTAPMIGEDILNCWDEVMEHGPKDVQNTECYVLAACGLTGERSLFIKTPEDVEAYAYNDFMGNIQLTFDAEAFFYVMEKASRKNKLVFFNNAVLPSITEANKFLALVDVSDLSKKDRNRAYTWMQQMVKRQAL